MAKALNLTILPFDVAVHDRSDFACGQPSLDTYLRTQANQDLRRRVAAVFVATHDHAPQTVIGYYTLAQASVSLDSLPEAVRKKLPRYPAVPVTLLGRLAVALSAQGRGVGTHLLVDALRRSVVVADEVASTGVIVQPIDGAAVAFYSRFGFKPLDDAPPRLMLTMATIRAATAATE